MWHSITQRYQNNKTETGVFYPRQRAPKRRRQIPTRPNGDQNAQFSPTASDAPTVNRFIETPALSAPGITPGVIEPATHAPAVADSSRATYFGDSGLLRIFDPEHQNIAATSKTAEALPIVLTLELPPVELQQSFAETFYEYCWTSCPILDRDQLFDSVGSDLSPLMANALALCGSQIRPPILQHADAADYYHRAKMLFYTDQEGNPLVALQSVMLLYWWSPRAPSVIHKDAAHWWTALAITYAQQMGLHREPQKVEDVGGALNQSLRRRIWWTLFTRERLTGICLGRPLLIDPADCNVRELSREDFPCNDRRADVFIYWVRLSAIIGRVGQHRMRNANSPSFPTHLAQELIEWVQSLPQDLKLPIEKERSSHFDRNVHHLHLPYLATLAVMHMNRSKQDSSHMLPDAYTAAMLAASCIARVLKHCLARGEFRFLGSISSWYVGVAILALLHTQRIKRLSSAGADDIRVLRVALDKIASVWPAGAVYVRGFQRLRLFDNPVGDVFTPPDGLRATGGDPEEMSGSSGIAPTSYFPFVTPETSKLAKLLLADQQDREMWDNISPLDPSYFQMQNWLDFDISNIFPDTGVEL